MIDTLSQDDSLKVYEIGYLLISSIPKEKVEETVESLKKILIDKGASILSMESAELIPILYTMEKKIGGTNHSFDQGYFGWFKFEISSSEIESIKKTFEVHTDMLRMLLINTVKENTYLGKKIAIAKVFSPDNTEDNPIITEKSSIEDMDKSIDEMVKEA